jgi:allantoinase
LIDAARDTGARVHVVHLADSGALPMLRKARDDGVRITVETCPHYLTFAAEEVSDGATSFKCCPPIREAAHREALWAALAEGDIDLVVSDHSPCTPDLKLLDVGDFGQAWGGIASLQVGLPVVWTGARARGIALTQVMRWMAEAPARLAGLPTKGAIAVGRDADLVAFAPDEPWTVGGLHHRNPVTPYAGRSLVGVVRRTWLRGRPADGTPRGRLLDRGQPSPPSSRAASS